MMSAYPMDLKVGDEVVIVPRQRNHSRYTGTVVKVGTRWASVRRGGFGRVEQIDRHSGFGKTDAGGFGPYFDGYTPEALDEVAEREELAFAIRDALRRNVWHLKMSTEALRTMKEMLT